MSDSQQTNPASPVDSTTPAPDQSLSQVSSDNRPDSIISADSPQISADSAQPPADSTQPPSEPNRPESIDSADSPQVPADSASQPSIPDTPLPAQPGNLANDALINQSSPPTPPEEPVSTVSADLPAVASAKAEKKADSPPATVSHTEPPAEEASPALVPEETFTPDQTTSPIPPTVSPDLSTPSDLNNPSPIISVSPPDNQVAQVQPEASKDTSDNVIEEKQNESAEIRSEPLQSPTMPSTEPEITPSPSPSVSFGDILSVNSPPAPPPPIDQLASPAGGLPVTDDQSVPSTVPDLNSLSNPSDLSSINPQPTTDDQQPSVSFGDLLKDSLKIEPTINIESSEPPTAPPVSSSSNPPPKTSNPQPISSPSPISDVKDKLVLLRQQAKLKKAQKKQSTLQKIIDLAKTKGKINNQETQKILHLPQSTLSDYFNELVSRGIFKKEGKGKATYYHL